MALILFAKVSVSKSKFLTKVLFKIIVSLPRNTFILESLNASSKYFFILNGFLNVELTLIVKLILCMREILFLISCAK